MTNRISNSAEETQQIAAEIAAQFKAKGGVIALIGDLGAGKTTFAQGFAKALGITDKIISPTFVLVRQHQLLNSRWLFHLDLYRLEGKINSKELGLEDMLEDPQNIVLIEWAEKIAEVLPHDTLMINFRKINQDQRQINLA